MGSERLGAGQHRARAKGREGLGTADQGAGPRAGQAGRTQAGCRAQGAGARHKGQGRVARFLFLWFARPQNLKNKNFATLGQGQRAKQGCKIPF